MNGPERHFSIALDTVVGAVQGAQLQVPRILRNREGPAGGAIRPVHGQGVAAADGTDVIYVSRSAVSQMQRRDIVVARQINPAGSV